MNGVPAGTTNNTDMDSMLRLEHFLDVVLRQSLKHVLEQRDKVYTMASDCCQLRDLFDEMRGLSSTRSFIPDSGTLPAAAPAGAHDVGQVGANSSIGNSNGAASDATQRNHIMVDLGNNFFVQCTIPDASRVLVNVGCGIILPMSTAEAEVFLKKRERLLRERAGTLSKEALRIKYRMRLVMEAITRLYDRTTGQSAGY
ncbi:putative Prefoldin subunit [Trypanosoma vivax]|uniref:Prefoldin subunit n=1 Tax=Trypanosoma vivax (strain Y486) TaxID=1055687 RepID=G0U8G7_TRYVY|nr:hypothetical protein TRVL_02538 [Trypanosoma vivax]KAH8604972.1 putative Prefoldin subunit [Trypanosoma vivax]CCC53893.1 conserved hypothetical protein [Trypanosoma vivax Y486]